MMQAEANAGGCSLRLNKQFYSSLECAIITEKELWKHKKATCNTSLMFY